MVKQGGDSSPAWTKFSRMTPPSAAGSEPTAQLSGRSRELAASSGIYIGTSSWRYDGWRGLVYRDHYPTKKSFHDRCLSEYAGHFPVVGVDATFYKFPDGKLLSELDARTPDHFKFGFKVTEEISVPKWPNHKRYGQRGGRDNPNFLSSELFTEKFLEPVQRLGDKLGPVMLQLGTLPREIIADGSFLEQLDRFLGALPSGYQLGVEIRNRDLFGQPYFDILRKHGVAHIHTSWSYMQPLAEQLRTPASFTAGFFAMRLLTPPQVAYAEAVETYYPYTAILKPQQQVRSALLEFLRGAIQGVRTGYVFVNNRLEGSSPLTIEHILRELLGDPEGVKGS